ncbi:MAG: hypothetical protein Q9162_002705 [Coniocarpon cinnabarinum]
MADKFSPFYRPSPEAAEKDFYNFNPPLPDQTPSRTRNKELARRRLSMAGFDTTMQLQRAQFSGGHHAFPESPDIDNRPAKRHQGPSKSFSSPRPSNLNGLRASYQAVKANAKQKLQTVAASKKRASSQGTQETPMLQRTRSFFGLRPTTSAFSPREMEQQPAAVDPSFPMPDAQISNSIWSNFPGAAARQSAREFGKSISQPWECRERDDSALGEHRVRSDHHRESGISLAAELENLRVDDGWHTDAVPDIPRQGLFYLELGDSHDTSIDTSSDPCTRLPTEICYGIFSFLNMDELVACEAVSRRWQRLSLDPSLRRQEFMRTWAPKHTTVSPVSGLSLGGEGVGKAKLLHQNWTKMHRARQTIARRWEEGPINPRTTAIYLNGHTDSVYCVQFDEDKIITGSRDRTFRIWDVKTGELRTTVGVPTARDNDNRHGLRIGTQDALAGPMRVINQLPAGSHRGRYLVPSLHHNASILCLQFDDELLVTGSSDHTLIMWDVRTFEPIRRLTHHSAGVLDIAFDKQKIVSCSKDGTICVWDRATGKWLTTLSGHRGPVNAVQMRGNLIVTASGEGCAKLWSIDPRDLGTPNAAVEGRCLKEFRSKDRGLACIEFSSDGRFVLAGGNDKVVYKFDARASASGPPPLVEVYKGHKGLVRSLYLDQAGGRIVTGSYDNELKCWDYVTDGVGVGNERWGLARWATSWILSAKSDYRRLVTTSQDGRALLVDFGVGVRGVGLLEG